MIEMLLFSLIAAWVTTRYVIGDAMAWARGTTSPRVRDRRMREAIATERRAAGRGPSIGEAVSGRIAEWIANPPEKGPRGPARQALSVWWADVWNEALRRHQARLREAEERRTSRPTAGARPAPPKRPEHPDDADTDIVDAEIVDDPPVSLVKEPASDQPEPKEDQPAPDPSPAPPQPAETTDTPAAEPEPVATVHPIRGDQHPMTTSTADVNGETLDPTAASAFVTQCAATADGLVAAIDQSLASLRERGVAGAPIEHLEQMQEHFTIAAGSAREADEYFKQHISKQDEIASDETLAGTVRDGYLDAANA